MRTALAALLAGATLAACGGASSSPTAITVQHEPTTHVGADGGLITLAVGQTGTVGAQSPLRVTFRGVEHDSRCPTDVQCVWEGNAAVDVRLARDGREARTTLHTTLEQNQVEYAGYVVRLAAVAPAPVSGRSIPANEYTVTLEVRRP